jgi:hypothetical protein
MKKMSKQKEKQHNTYKKPHIGTYVQAICDKYMLPKEEVRAFLFHEFQELTKKEVCANCGESMKIYWHNLSTGLVSCLIKAIEYVQKNHDNQFNLLTDLSLTKVQYNNFQKLRFHGLVAKVDNKLGYWLITRRGGQFLRGEISVPTSVQTFRNKVTDHSEKKVSINDFKGQFPYFQSEFAYEVQQGKLL